VLHALTTEFVQDLDRDDYVPPTYQPGLIDEVFELHKQEQATRKRQDKTKQDKLQRLGFLGDSLGDGLS